jgi:hypothetical protein
MRKENDMDEYIDRNQAIKNAVRALKGVSHITAVDVATALEETPTADVVQKSEVERLQAEKDALIKNYAECMKDYASEIFAEIEENLNNLIRYYKEKREYVTEIEYSELEQRYCDIKIRTFEERLLKIAELKKKYIGGNDDRE